MGGRGGVEKGGHFWNIKTNEAKTGNLTQNSAISEVSLNFDLTSTEGPEAKNNFEDFGSRWRLNGEHSLCPLLLLLQVLHNGLNSRQMVTPCLDES